VPGFVQGVPRHGWELVVGQSLVDLV